MTKPTLVIGNKNYSSWSMRSWLPLRGFDIDFVEVQLKFNIQGWRENISRWSPAGQVPVLWLDGEPVWDTLAFAEAIAERFGEGGALLFGAFTAADAFYAP
jgi:glutathione S-transferase